MIAPKCIRNQDGEQRLCIRSDTATAQERSERETNEKTRALGVIKDMRGDGDGLVRTPAEVLMVAGHVTALFCQFVCVLETLREIEEDRNKVCVCV